MARVLTGLDRLVTNPAVRAPLQGLRLGVLCHQASVTAGLVQAIPAMLAAGLRVERIFAPEHGLYGAAQDMDAVGHEVDPLVGREVTSLYGTSEASLRPTPAQLAGLDAMVIDLQDVGARYYTFVYTAAFTIEACARAGLPVWVLDRPNPLGGAAVEGNVVAPGLTSFVGAYPLAVRHGMTLGELAGMLNETEGFGANLHVLRMEGWRREFSMEDTQLPWVAPSPNMPTPDTARVYPGACLLEGTELSEARGTTRPFEWFGAPWLDLAAVTSRLPAEALAGAVLRPMQFIPSSRKFAGERCLGFQLHVTDRARFRPFRAYLALIRAVRHAQPEHFRYRHAPYEFVDRISAMRLLLGDDRLYALLEAEAPWAETEALCESGDAFAAFADARDRHLLYD